MKTYKEVKITAKEIETVVCNVCGEGIHVNSFGMVDDHVSLEKTWGFGSPHDGKTHCIDICQKCYAKIIYDMVIKP